MAFKKQLTPLSRRGRMTTHRGKGAVSQRLDRGERESVTGGDAFDRALSRYPTAVPEPPPPTAAPPLGGPALGSAAPPVAPRPGLPDDLAG